MQVAAFMTFGGNGSDPYPGSDLLGRSTAFNGTLLFTSLFGLAATITNSFWSLCLALFFLGSAVGVRVLRACSDAKNSQPTQGSLPTDGTLILEQLPNSKKYLVTALTIFFSFGSVFTAIVGLIIVPRYTCSTDDCDMSKDNLGWKYLLVCLGFIVCSPLLLPLIFRADLSLRVHQQTLLMTVLRVIFFRLYESPRYLVAAGRPTEAMENLQLISKFNGEELDLSLRDVRDHFGTIRSRRSPSYSAISPHNDRSEEERPFLPTTSSSIIFNADTERDDETTRVPGSGRDSVDNYATGETNTTRNNTHPDTALTLETSISPTVGSSLTSPSQAYGHGHQRSHTGHSIAEDDDDDERKFSPRSPRPRTSRSPRSCSSSVLVSYKSMGWLPRTIRKPLWAYIDRMALVLTPEWIWTTLTVWAMWFSMSLGMFSQR